MMGAATRIHGYVARDGLGITLLKNQIEAINPVTKNSNFDEILNSIFI
jgi:hypothetical protein